MKIALGGPPRSGKSCLREKLKAALRSRSEVWPYFLTTNPDGEGAWFQETYAHDRELAQRLRAAYKNGWTEDRVAIYAEWVKNCTAPLTFIDLGGRPDEASARICGHATHAILIAPDPEGWKPWQVFCGRSNLSILAELVSDYHAAEDRLEKVGADGVFRGAIHRLERGEVEGVHPVVDALAEHILRRLESSGLALAAARPLRRSLACGRQPEKRNSMRRLGLFDVLSDVLMPDRHHTFWALVRFLAAFITLEWVIHASTHLATNTGVWLFGLHGKDRLAAGWFSHGLEEVAGPTAAFVAVVGWIFGDKLRYVWRRRHHQARQGLPEKARGLVSALSTL